MNAKECWKILELMEKIQTHSQKMMFLICLYYYASMQKILRNTLI